MKSQNKVVKSYKLDNIANSSKKYKAFTGLFL